ALFGWVGDRFGRKQALIWSVLAMAFPSFFIGILPGVDTIGIAAPILLLLCRLLQGIAVGGEYGASAVFLVEGAEPAGGDGWEAGRRSVRSRARCWARRPGRS
nr:MFS transporter [Gemmatimonadales bacterium]